MIMVSSDFWRIPQTRPLLSPYGGYSRIHYLLNSLRKEIVMNNPAGGKSIAPGEGAGNEAQYHKKDFWSSQSSQYIQPHYRLEKAAQMINGLAQGKECELLDVGCGPATLMHLLSPNVHYYGI